MQSQPVRLIRIPLALFGLPSKDAQVHQRMGDFLQQMKQTFISQATQSGGDMPLDMLVALQTMPYIFRLVGDDVEIPSSCFFILCEHMYLVWADYLRDPAANSGLESTILTSAEYTYRLLLENHTRFQKTKVSLPLRETQLDHYTGKLKMDPYWAMQWMRHDFIINFYQEVLAWTYSNHDLSAAPAHFYHYIKTRNKSQEVKEREMAGILPTIASSQSYSFLVACSYPKLDIKPLLETIKKHDGWTYNFLRWVQMPMDYRRELEAALVRHPGWLVQYVQDMNPSNGDELLSQTLAGCKNQYLKPWLEEFVRKYRDRLR